MFSEHVPFSSSSHIPFAEVFHAEVETTIECLGHIIIGFCINLSNL